MDHSTSEKCPHGQRRYRMCLDHNPEWENIGGRRREPNPGIFGKKTYWTTSHCGQSMARYKVVQTRRCKKCGRTEDRIEIFELALCLCCGYHFKNSGYVLD